MTARLAVIQLLFAVALLAAAPVSAKEPQRAPAPVAVSAAELAGERLPWPEPPPELTQRYPTIANPRILRLSDGRLALASPRRIELAKVAVGVAREGVWVTELDAGGAPERGRWIPWLRHTALLSIVPARDGGYFLWDDQPPLILRADRDGQHMWQLGLRRGPASEYDRMVLVELADGSILAAGGTDEDESTPHIDRATRLAADGTLLWQREHGPQRKGGAVFSVVALDGGSAIIANGRLFYRIDASGRRLWRRTIGSDLDAYPSLPGTFLLAGFREPPPGKGASRLWLMRVDGAGRALWRRDAVAMHPGRGDGSNLAWFPQSDGGIVQYVKNEIVRDERDKDGCSRWSEHLLARFDAAGARRWLRTLLPEAERPCSAPRDETALLLDAHLLPNGRLLLLWSDTGSRFALDPQLWLMTLPFD